MFPILKVNVRLKYFLPLFLLVIISCLSSCALVAGTVDSMRRAGLTPASRESLLKPAALKFNEAIAWGDISLALSLTSETYKNDLRDKLLHDKGKIKVIDTVVDLTEYQNSSFDATVFVTRRSYTIPFYIAETARIKQYWNYSMTSGWQVKDQEVLAQES